VLDTRVEPFELWQIIEAAVREVRADVAQLRFHLDDVDQVAVLVQVCAVQLQLEYIVV